MARIRIKCPGCSTVYAINLSKIEPSRHFVNCPKCKSKIALRKETAGKTFKLPEALIKYRQYLTDHNLDEHKINNEIKRLSLFVKFLARKGKSLEESKQSDAEDFNKILSEKVDDKILSQYRRSIKRIQDFLKKRIDDASRSPAQPGKTPAFSRRGKKRIFSKILILLFIVVLGISFAWYWKWNEHSLSRLSRNLDEADSALSPSASSRRLISSFDLICSNHLQAKQKTLPLFSSRYSSIEERCAALLKESPLKVAKWVRNKRSLAWSRIDSNGKVESIVDSKELVVTINSLEKIMQTGLAAKDRIKKSNETMLINPKSFTGTCELIEQIKITAKLAIDLSHVWQKMVRVIGRTRSHVHKGLRKIDSINNEMEQYVKIWTLRHACNSMKSAAATIERANFTLNNIPVFSKKYQNDLARALRRAEQDKIKQISTKIILHISRARSELRKAKRKNGLIVGNETTVNIKDMFLDTRPFYNLMDMNSNTDLISWIMSYENSMARLIKEAEEIQKMDSCQ